MFLCVVLGGSLCSSRYVTETDLLFMLHLLAEEVRVGLEGLQIAWRRAQRERECVWVIFRIHGGNGESIAALIVVTIILGLHSGTSRRTVVKGRCFVSVFSHSCVSNHGAKQGQPCYYGQFDGSQ